MRAKQNRSLGREEAAGPPPAIPGKMLRFAEQGVQTGLLCRTRGPPLLHRDPATLGSARDIRVFLHFSSLQSQVHYTLAGTSQATETRTEQAGASHAASYPATGPHPFSAAPQTPLAPPPPPPPMRPCNRRHSKPFCLKNPQRHLSASVHVAPTCDSR